MKKSTAYDIEIRSESVQEILGRPPRWIIRRGITIIMLVLVIMLIGSYFYKYPDIINANIMLTAVNPPIPIIAKTSGKIDSILVVDRQIVLEEQVLGIMENPAKYKDVLILKEKLESIKTIFLNSQVKTDVFFGNNYQLGSVHDSYAAFVTQWQNYHTTYRLDFIGEQIQSLQKQINDYTIYFSQLKEQVFACKKDLELSQKQFNRDSLLFTNGILAENLYENSNSYYLKQVIGYKGSLANLTNTQIKINQLQQQVIELKKKRTEQEDTLLSDLKERFEVLKNRLVMWENMYLLRSSIKGRITNTNIWSANQFVTSGSIVFTVVPVSEQKIIGKVQIPLSGSGKVMIGQRVNVKLDNYPYMEYGMLKGVIYNISMVPIIEKYGTFYIAEVSFSNRLTTNYKIELPFLQGMQGTCEIITNERRLIQRFYEPLKTLFREKL